ncbi:zinc finger protein 84-like [Sander lucioperca]|uniref:zinc finger protein 84-like n=1 Tax=Sander lucioperca TaxID=283035 RepID=UPI001653B2AB|nr:zinc finger protein 84-like [Sander lucioperca]
MMKRKLRASDCLQICSRSVYRSFLQINVQVPTCPALWSYTVSPQHHHLHVSRNVQQLLVVKEEVPPEQKEWSSSVDQEEPEPPPHIKEEQEELWSSQEGEQLQGLEEADITKFPFTPVPVKSEDDEEEAQSSQLHQRQTQHMETEADGEDCGGPEPARNSHPLLQPETEDQTGDSSDPETDDSADWKETREPQSALNSLKHDSTCKKTFSCSECGKRFGFKSNLKKHMRIHTGEKPFSCSECGRAFTERGTLKTHMMTHSGEKPFSCSVCKKSFTYSGALKKHIRTHTGERPFSCSVCNTSFTQRGNLQSHMAVHTDVQQLSVVKEEVPPEQQEYSSIVDQEEPEPPPNIKEEQEGLWSSQEGEQLQGLEEADITKFPFTPVPVKSGDDEEEAQSSQLHQRQTQHMETEADGEDCGGPEPARNSHPLFQPETEDQTGDSSEPETDDSADWKETREPQSALKTLKRNSRCKKPFSCSECERRFGTKQHLKTHMRTHTGEKPFRCSECGRKFDRKGSLNRHMRTHTGEKPFCCSICKKSFTHSANLGSHMTVHTREKRFSCSVCDKTFQWLNQVKRHKCVGRKSSQLHQSQTEENREAEPPASRETQHMVTEADGEDCGGPEPARNSHPLLQPETEDQTGDSSEPETDDSADWKETREPQSARNSLKDESKCKKTFSCSKCGKRFGRKQHLKRHMMTHMSETRRDSLGPLPVGNSFQTKRL